MCTIILRFKKRLPLLYVLPHALILVHLRRKWKTRSFPCENISNQFEIILISFLCSNKTDQSRIIAIFQRRRRPTDAPRRSIRQRRSGLEQREDQQGDHGHRERHARLVVQYSLKNLLVSFNWIRIINSNILLNGVNTLGQNSAYPTSISV